MISQRNAFRHEAGTASFIALGIVLVTGVLLIGYGVWVRFAVNSTMVFEDRVGAQHRAREGVGMAIALLMEDQEPEVDWLGEPWAQTDGMQTDTVTIFLRDEGSRLGLNWMDSTLWEALPGMSRQRARTLDAWLGSVDDLADRLADQGTGLDPQDVAALKAVTTAFSAFNVNAVDPEVLYDLFISFGENPGQARRVVEQIVSARADGTLNSMEQLTRVATALRPDLRRVAEKWLVFSGPININTVSEDVLTYLFKAYDVPGDRIENLLDARSTQPLRSVPEVARVLGVELFTADGRPTSLGRWLTFESRFFQITGETHQPPFRITAVVSRLWDVDAKQWNVEIVSWKEESGL